MLTRKALARSLIICCIVPYRNHRARRAASYAICAGRDNIIGGVIVRASSMPIIDKYGVYKTPTIGETGGVMASNASVACRGEINK